MHHSVLARSSQREHFGTFATEMHGDCRGAARAQRPTPPVRIPLAHRPHVPMLPLDVFHMHSFGSHPLLLLGRTRTQFECRVPLTSLASPSRGPHPARRLPSVHISHAGSHQFWCSHPARCARVTQMQWSAAVDVGSLCCPGHLDLRMSCGFDVCG
jgi:hypothetical protein